jgi:predicted HicB family RNase H-like nuclease
MEPTKDKQQITTLGVDKKLARKAKIQAAVKGTTLKEFTEEAIREKLEREKK